MAEKAAILDGGLDVGSSELTVEQAVRTAVR
jgi:hypothetical protein